MTNFNDFMAKKLQRIDRALDDEKGKVALRLSRKVLRKITDNVVEKYDISSKEACATLHECCGSALMMMDRLEDALIEYMV